MARQHTYDRNDIQRYLRQQMSREEMHAFEKAMMDDPFLADAFEGYEQSDSVKAAAHLQVIQQQILGTEEQTKVVPISSLSAKWLRVAAMIILFVSAGLITYKLFDKPTAVNKEVATATPKPPVITADTVSPAEEPTAAPEVLAQQTTKAKQASPPAGSPIIEPSRPSGNIAMLKQEEVAKEQAETSMLAKGDIATITDKDLQNTAPEKKEQAAKSMMAMRFAKPEQEIKGKVVDANGNPLPFATITTDDKKGAVVDREGNFTLKANDSIVDANIAYNGYNPLKTKLRSETNNRIVMSPSTEVLSEVVVTRSARTGTSAAIPDGGWEKFHLYVDSSVQKLRISKESNINSRVDLEFEIDKAGLPKNIKVLNKPDTTLVSEAINILKKGPKWQALKKNVKAKVTIRF